MKKLSNAAKSFLTYSFRGNGKYYTTEQGSRHYRNSDFENFYRSNTDCINIIESGNDAPRGGRTGDFVIVEFNENFYAKYQWFFDAKKAEAERKEALEAAKKIEIEALGNQSEKLVAIFTERPDRLARVIEAIETRSSNSSRSGDWRSWVRMKAAKWVAGGRFDLLTLSAPEIKNIAYSLTED